MPFRAIISILWDSINFNKFHNSAYNFKFLGLGQFGPPETQIPDLGDKKNEQKRLLISSRLFGTFCSFPWGIRVLRFPLEFGGLEKCRFRPKFRLKSGIHKYSIQRHFRLISIGIGKVKFQTIKTYQLR